MKTLLISPILGQEWDISFIRPRIGLSFSRSVPFFELFSVLFLLLSCVISKKSDVCLCAYVCLWIESMYYVRINQQPTVMTYFNSITRLFLTKSEWREEMIERAFTLSKCLYHRFFVDLRKCVSLNWVVWYVVHVYVVLVWVIMGGSEWSEYIYKKRDSLIKSQRHAIFLCFDHFHF